MENKIKYSPICIFIYNRKEKSVNLLKSLSLCEEFKFSEIFIFSDGPKVNDHKDRIKVQETRKSVKSFLCNYNVKFVCNTENKGLAKSVYSGVSEVLKTNDNIIVFEDDLIVNKGILKYFNFFLEELRDLKNVFQISGHLFYDTNKKIGPTNFYMSNTNSWGWATWADSWKSFNYENLMSRKLRLTKDQILKFNLNNSYNFYKILLRQYSGKIDSWAILWYLTVFLNNGLVLYPNKTLILNKGLDGTGTHTLLKDYQSDLSDEDVLLSIPISMDVSNKYSEKVKKFMKKNVNKNIFQKIYLKIKSTF